MQTIQLSPDTRFQLDSLLVQHREISLGEHARLDLTTAKSTGGPTRLERVFQNSDRMVGLHYFLNGKSFLTQGNLVAGAQLNDETCHLMLAMPYRTDQIIEFEGNFRKIMKNLLNPPDRDALIDRLAHLTPDRQRRWGTMSSGQVLPHLTDPLRTATGDRPAQPMHAIFSKPIIQQLIVWIAPWPKGAPTAEEFIQGQKGTPPAEFERDKHALLLAIHQFANHPKDKPYAPSPVFGNLSRRAWGRLMWRHLDHHLRQFGL